MLGQPALSYFDGRTRHIDRIRTDTEQDSCTLDEGRERKQARTFIGPRMVPFHRVSMMSSASAKPYDTEPGTDDMATRANMQPAGTIHAKHKEARGIQKGHNIHIT